jgi:hypothetical protein
MKIIKTLTIAVFTTITVGTQAQNVFFPTQPGKVLMYVHKNENNEVQGYSRQTIKNVQGSGRNMTISYTTENLDINRNKTSEMSCRIIIENDVMMLDLNCLFAGRIEDPRVRIRELTGTPMELPNNMRPGQSFNDASVTMNIARGVIRARIEISMTDRKCVAIEYVTVPAGTFESHKVTQTTTTTVMGRTSKSRTLTWYTPNLGVVKSRTYNDENELQNSRMLIEMR